MKNNGWYMHEYHPILHPGRDDSIVVGNSALRTILFPIHFT